MSLREQRYFFIKKFNIKVTMTSSSRNTAGIEVKAGLQLETCM